jgi:hypothetical protein
MPPCCSLCLQVAASFLYLPGGEGGWGGWEGPRGVVAHVQGPSAVAVGGFDRGAPPADIL